MIRLPQVSHERMVRALQRTGFRVLRQGKHISMTDGRNIIIIPRQYVIKPGTLRHILDAAGISAEELKKLL